MAKRYRRTGRRTRAGKNSKGKVRRKRTQRPRRMSRRLFMGGKLRGGVQPPIPGGTLIINKSESKEAVVKKYDKKIPPRSFLALKPTEPNPNFNLIINDKSIEFSVGVDGERNIVTVDDSGSINHSKDPNSEYTTGNLKDGTNPHMVKYKQVF